MIRPGTGVGKEKKKVVTGPVNVPVGKKADVRARRAGGWAGAGASGLDGGVLECWWCPWMCLI